MNWLQHLDVIVLALLLVYTVAGTIGVSYGYHTIRRPRYVDSARRSLAAQLSIRIGNLNSIACVAPYLGLLGTCIGILSAFRGSGMEKHALLEMIASSMAAALVPAAAGIIVALPATCSYNYLRTRLDLLENEIPTRRLPLAKRFSGLPAFAIAAQVLALSITAFMILRSGNSPRGLYVYLPEVGVLEPENHLQVEPVLIRLLDMGGGPPTIFVNSRRTPQNQLKDAVEASLRVRGTVNVAADKSVSWADVASAIDVAEGLDAKVILLTAQPIRYSGHNW